MRRPRLKGTVLATMISIAACGGPPFTSAGAGGDAAARSDAEAGVAGDAGRFPGAGLCGSVSCAAHETCCVYVGAGAARHDCHNSCPPPQNGDHLSALQCARSPDCGVGTICCIERVGNDNRSSCAIACASNQAQLCDPSATATGCTANAPCSTTNITDWNLPVTFGTCGGVSVP